MIAKHFLSKPLDEIQAATPTLVKRVSVKVVAQLALFQRLVDEIFSLNQESNLGAVYSRLQKDWHSNH